MTEEGGVAGSASSTKEIEVLEDKELETKKLEASEPAEEEAEGGLTRSLASKVTKEVEEGASGTVEVTQGAFSNVQRKECSAANVDGKNEATEEETSPTTSIGDLNSKGEVTSTVAKASEVNNDLVNKVNRVLPDTTTKEPKDNFLREFLHNKLALVAAVSQRSELYSARPLYRPGFHPHLRPCPPYCPPHFPPQRFPHMMEPALLAAANGQPRDFSTQGRGHNNNELKDTTAASNFMSQFLKMRQEMVLNMSKAASAGSDNVSPRSAGETDEDNKLEDEEEPIDLQRTVDGRSSVHSSTDAELNLPRSPSSDAGMSSSSAGEKGATTKTSRLEQIVSSMRNSSPLPGSGSQGAGSVNGCKKRKLYQPVQHESSKSPQPNKDDDPEVEEVEDHDLKKKRSKTNDENADPKDEETMSNTSKSHGDDGNSTTGHVPRQRAKQVRDSTKVHPSHFKDGPGNMPIFPGASTPGVNPLQAQYMEMARRFFLQEQQDKITKEAITKEIINDTIAKNNDIASKLVAIFT